MGIFSSFFGFAKYDFYWKMANVWPIAMEWRTRKLFRRMLFNVALVRPYSGKIPNISPSDLLQNSRNYTVGFSSLLYLFQIRNI